jgi:hypothetical protein
MHVHVFGIKIITRTTTTDSNIGIASGVFQLIQSPVSGATGWKTGIIALGGLGKWKRELDPLDGGNIAADGSFQFILSNTNNLFQTIQSYGIVLDNCIVQIWCWDGEETTVTPICEWIGRCQVPVADSLSITVSCIGLASGRVANILKNINTVDYPFASSKIINNSVPAVFGKLNPTFDANGLMSDQSMAMFQRTADAQDEDTYSNFYFTGQNPQIKIFPVVLYTTTGGGAHKELYIKFSDDLTFSVFSPDETYCIITSGNGSGQRRKIVTITPNADPTQRTALIEVETVFSTDLSIANDNTRSWVQIVVIHEQFSSDFMPCKSFLKGSDGSEISSHEIYNESNNILTRIAEYGLSVVDTNKNSLKIEGEQLGNSNNEVSSFIILPTSNLSVVPSATITDWNNGSVDYTGFNRYALDSLIFMKEGYPFAHYGGDVIVNANQANDKISTSSADVVLSITFDGASHYKYLRVLQFDLPAIPKGIDIDSIYFGIKGSTAALHAANFPGLTSSFHVVFKRFAYTQDADRIMGDKPITLAEQTGDTVLDNLPSFYYSDTVTSDNSQFYRDSVAVGGNYGDLKGYNLFKITSDINVYNTYVKGGLFSYRDAGLISPPDLDSLHIYEMAIIIKLKNSTISDKIYSPLSGRIFSDTWGSRKTVIDLMQKPRDLFEHFCRLQNFSDSAITQPGAGWGKGYPSGTLPIDTTSLNTLTNQMDALLPCDEIKDTNEGYTDKLRLSLCRTFGIVGYIDNLGKECAGQILTVPAGVLPAIAFGDVIDRKSIKVNNWPTDKVYPEMQVKYRKDIVTDELKGIIQLLNPEASASSSAYCIGFSYADMGSGTFTGSKAESLWLKAHALYLKTEKNQIDKIPDTLINCLWANGAGGYDIAVYYLGLMLDLMACKILELQLHFSLCSTWMEGTWFTFNSAKHTNSVSLNCMVIEIEHDPNEPHISYIKAIMLNPVLS